MDSKVSVQARAVEHGTEGVCCMLNGQTPLCINVHIDRANALPQDAEIILTAHEIFTGQTKVLPGPASEVGGPAKEDLKLRIPADTFILEPGFWHVLVDVMRGVETLAGTNAGSTEIYVRGADESPLHVLASYNLARSEFAFDRQYGVYFARYRDRLPSSVDPFSDQDAGAFRRDVAIEETLSAEDVHHAGTGFLLAAHAFRTLGESERAEYCDEALARLVRTTAELMLAEDGRLHALTGVDEERAHGVHDRAGDALALKFLAQSYFYFHYGPLEEKGYARYALETAKELFRYQLAQPLGTGCAGHCRANDGRILDGLASYCLAHKAEHGQFFSPGAERALIDFATETVRNLLASDGWYDDGCVEADGQHVWRANIELASGLLAVLQMVEQLQQRGLEKASSAHSQLREGVRSALGFVTSSPRPLPDLPPVLPSSLPPWARGGAYQVCAEYLSRFEADPAVEQFMRQLPTDRGATVTQRLGDLSAAGAGLHLCDEYSALESPPRPPWWA